jgi:hypothetical protein
MSDPVANIDLLEKVAQLIARQEIRDCVYRCARGLDRHDPAILRSAFHRDAIINIGEFVGGLDEFVRWSSAGHEERFGGHSHNITCHHAEVNGDEAHTESYVLMGLREKDSAVVHLTGGRYIDRFERRRGEWRIALRRLAVDWRIKGDGSTWQANKPGYPYGVWGAEDISYQRPLELPAELLAKLAARTQSSTSS